MRNSLERQVVAILAADGRVVVLSVRPGEIQTRDHDLEPAGTVRVDRTMRTASVDEYDGLVLPGGTITCYPKHPHRSAQLRRLSARPGTGHRPQPHHQPAPGRSPGVVPTIVDNLSAARIEY
ncbi:hypothetical protein HNP40_000325 [Mycobacteroides chelonae]|nr:hypothetical protein [Mycobacteroides chelonae]